MLKFIKNAVTVFPQLHLPKEQKASSNRYYKRMVSFYAALFQYSQLPFTAILFGKVFSAPTKLETAVEKSLYFHLKTEVLERFFKSMNYTPC